MIGSKNVAAEKVQRDGVRRVNEWLQELLPDDEKEEDDGGTAAPGKDTSVIVNQLACKEAGCPDVEVVITLIRAKPRPKLMFKIYKAAAELGKDEVESALRKAEAAEQEELGVASQKQAHGHDSGHDHGHDHGHGHGGHGDDCCSHDHGHGDHAADQKKQSHEHAHGHGGHGDDCCGHDHGHGDHAADEKKQSHEHAHGGDDHGHVHGDSCCGHDHGHHGGGQKQSHEHGH